ncbi:hypothetical protein EUTSA_v10009650mg, partial [Eutrema salsugineum]
SVVAKPNLFFPPTCFGKRCKLSSKTKPNKAISYLQTYLSEREFSWLKNHRQFKHLFHRDVEKFHKVQAMWSLILRCVDLKKKKNELWFVVTGILIRYSIREHALITGLDCPALPDDYRKKKQVDNTFVSRIFRRKNKISLSAVSKKLQSKEESADGDKLKLGVLYFLASVIASKKKTAAIDSFLIQNKWTWEDWFANSSAKSAWEDCCANSSAKSAWEDCW